MKKVNILWFSLNSLFLIVFNILFFMLCDVGNANASVWVSYVFIHIAYLALLLTPFLVRKSVAETDYSRPLYTVTTSWFLTQLLVGVTLIVLSPDSTKITVSIHVVLAAIFIAWLIANLLANEKTADNVERREAELLYVKESSAKLQSVLQRITDRSTVKKVERVYDLIRSSPSKSNAGVRSLEQQVINEIERLAGENDTEQIVSIADNIYRLAEERNRQLKTNNR